MDEETIAYFRSRERVEREAAEKAASEIARQIHLDLAAGYETLARQGEDTARAD